ncbi:phosphatase PAP2 family protein [Dethiosulfatibacter aminovorans]|nr:phosphatase PAP2 family protein [Dethiosulfatibacter aminovorans]
MILATMSGNKGAIWILTALLLLASKKTRKIGVIMSLALIISFAAGEGILKHIIQRPRPYDVFPGVQLLVAKSTAYSFPSGHTTTSFAAFYVLSRYLRTYSCLFGLLACIISFSRLYLFMHYPTDILAGIVLGLSLGKVAIWIYENKLKKLMHLNPDHE